MSDEHNYDDCQIVQFFHCSKCIEDYAQGAPGTENQSPATYARISVGYTPEGVQVWCHRHGLNIVHFAVPEGQKFHEVP